MESGYAENVQRQIGQRMDAQMNELQSTLREINQRVVTYVKQRPAACVVGAFALGYLLAKVARHV
jgi:hypothetical protein